MGAMFPTEPVPEKLGAYKVIRRLAGAGSADLYLGRMEGPMGFQRVCALKLVPNSIEGDARFAEELAREAAICASLNHPAIVRMFDFFEHEKRLVLVLEHVEGADLERLLQHLARRKQKLSDDAIWYIAHELAGALAHAHGARDESGAPTPVVHRNLVPESVLISWDGEVRLSGFGLGKILGRSPDTVVGGSVKGTPGFMAPEQHRGERVTPRADVYGLGALVWSLLAGRRPPATGRPESIGTLRKDIPREIAAAIDATLEPSADNRKITCAELEQWLEKITKVEHGRTELREKVLLLRSTRAEPTGESRSARSSAAQPRRRVSLRAVKASQRPPNSGPLSVPPPASSRAPSARVDEREEPPESRRGGESAPPPSARPSSRTARPPSASVGPPATSGSRTQSPGPRAFEQSTHPAPADEAAPARPALPHRGRPAQRTMIGGLDGQKAELGAPAAPPAPTPGPARFIAPPPAPPIAALLDEALAPEPAALPPLAAPPAADSGGGWRDVSNDAAPLALIASPVERPRPPTLSLALDPRPTRPLAPIQSLLVIVATAGVVVGSGIWIVERRVSPTADAASARPAASAAPSSAPSAEATAARAAVTAAPTATPSPVPTPAAAPDVAPPGYAYLTVTTTTSASVFLNGNFAGEANQPIKVVCGRFFLRLGQVSDAKRFPEWVGQGSTVLIPCQGSLTMAMKPP